MSIIQHIINNSLKADTITRNIFFASLLDHSKCFILVFTIHLRCLMKLFNEIKLFALGVMAFELISLSLVFPSAVGLSDQTQQYRFKTYTDSEGRFEVGYPENWYLNEEPSRTRKNVTVQFDYDKPIISANGDDVALPSVRIIVRDSLPDEISLDGLSNKFINSASLNPLVSIEESGYANLSGYTAYSMECLVQNESSQMIWTLRDSKVYLIEYKADSQDYETYLPVFQQMVSTFDISD
jgi:PsbP-like protein